MTLCSNSILERYTPEGQEAVSLFCRRWTCETCKKTRIQQLYAQITGGNPTIFLTLTSKPHQGETPNDAAISLVHAWTTLRRRIKTYMRWRNLPSLMIVAKTEAGWPHLHIYLRCKFIPQKWISEQMNNLIASPICWIEAIKDQGDAARYMTEYGAEQAHQFGTLKRYRASSDYDQRPKHEPPEKREPGWNWQVVRDNIDHWCKSWRDVGWLVTFKTPHHGMAHRPP